MANELMRVHIKASIWKAFVFLPWSVIYFICFKHTQTRIPGLPSVPVVKLVRLWLIVFQCWNWSKFDYQCFCIKICQSLIISFTVLKLVRLWLSLPFVCHYILGWNGFSMLISNGETDHMDPNFMIATFKRNRNFPPINNSVTDVPHI